MGGMLKPSCCWSRKLYKSFIETVRGTGLIQKLDSDLMMKTLDHIKVFEDGALRVVFLDGTEIECRSEEM